MELEPVDRSESSAVDPAEGGGVVAEAADAGSDAANAGTIKVTIWPCWLSTSFACHGARPGAEAVSTFRLGRWGWESPIELGQRRHHPAFDLEPRCLLRRTDIDHEPCQLVTCRCLIARHCLAIRLPLALGLRRRLDDNDTRSPSDRCWSSKRPD